MAVSREHRRSPGTRASRIRAPWRILRAAVAAAPLLTALPAAAQWFGDGPIPLEAVVRIVTRHGFTGFSPPRLAGDVYIVHAISDRGERVRLVIDAHDGRILRPLGFAEQFAARPGRLRPRDYAVSPDPDDEDEVERFERFRRRGLEQDALVPPRSIGRPPRGDRDLSRRLDNEDDREEFVEPYRAPSTGRELGPAPTMRSGPAPERRTVRIEPPAPEPAAPRATSRPRPTTPAPAPVEAAKPERPADAKPSTPAAAPTPSTTTAAVPTPAAPKETAPVTPAAPAAPTPPTAPSEPTKPEAAKPVPASQPPKPQPPAAQAAAQPPAPAPHAGPPPKVRVIEGVTPVLPQSGEAKAQ